MVDPRQQIVADATGVHVFFEIAVGARDKLKVALG
jgi:hypothetical protein